MVGREPERTGAPGGEPAAAPGSEAPESALLPAELATQMLAHARDGYPDEACGIVAGDRFWAEGGCALRFYPTANVERSALRYLIDAQEQLRVLLEIDERDEAVWGIFHSHTRTPAEPSPTDRRQAFWPGTLYLIASLSDLEDPPIRAWLLDGGEVREVPLREA